jgi:GT2 family glycosyltransferase
VIVKWTNLDRVMVNPLFPLVSIIILNFNGESYIESCLSSVLKTCYPNFEIILVDNNSTDRSMDIVQEKFKGVINLSVVSNNRNVGPAEGYNIGAKHAKGEYLAFLNNDIEVDPNWLSELVKGMENTEGTGAAGCKQLLLRNRSMIDDVGGFIDAYGFVHPRCCHGEIDYGQYDSIETVFRYGETALVVRRDVFEYAGGFDSKYNMWYEDNDLCWRIYLSGYTIISVPSAIIYHVVSGSTGKIPKPQTYYWNERNRITTLIKNYEFISLIKILPVLLIFEIGLTIIFFFKGNRDYAISIIRALKDVMFDDDIWDRRRKIQEIRKIPDKLLFKRFVKFKFKLIINRLRSSEKIWMNTSS